MRKKAIIIISLVPESDNESNDKLREDIRRSLKCDWLEQILRITVREGDQL